MSIVSVEEIWEGRQGNFDTEFTREYTRTFRVLTSGPNVGTIAVWFASGIPKLFDAYTNAVTGEMDVYSRCVGIKPVQDADDGCRWIVTCDYRNRYVPASGGASGFLPGAGTTVGNSQNPEPGAGGAAEKPEYRWPKIKWTNETRQESYSKVWDITMAPGSQTRDVIVRNSAKQPFDPMPVHEIAMPVLNVTRWETSFDPLQARKFAYAYNHDSFLFANPYQAQCYPIEAELEFINDVPYWQVNYKIRFAPEGYDVAYPEILDAGRYEIVGGVLRTIKDVQTRQPVTEDWPLKAGVAMTLAELTAGDYVFLPLPDFQGRNFADLKLV